MHTIDMPNMHH